MYITISLMLEKLRLFLVVLEEGSLRRAAECIRQVTLTNYFSSSFNTSM